MFVFQTHQYISFTSFFFFLKIFSPNKLRQLSFEVLAVALYILYLQDVCTLSMMIEFILHVYLKEVFNLVLFKHLCELC